MEREEVLFSHFRPDERIFVERVIDWVNRVANRYQPILTPFLNPREQAIVGMWVRRSPDLNVSSDGGVTGAERRRVRIYPPYMEDPDHGLAFLEVKSTNRSATLLHPDILGSLLGLGVKREVLGDIFVTDTGCQLIATQEIAGYIELQLNRVGRTPVRVKEIHRDDLCSPKQMTETVRVSGCLFATRCCGGGGFSLVPDKGGNLDKKRQMSS